MQAYQQRSNRREMFPSNFIGFNALLENFERFAENSNQTFPPYNIIQTNDSSLQIQVSLAGYNPDDIDIIVKEENLTIKTKVDYKTHTDEIKFIHHGVSARKFERAFSLAPNIVVKNADMVNGILVINLEEIIPEDQRARNIPIGGDTRGSAKLLNE